MAATTEDRAYSGLPNKAVSAADGIDYAYRDTGGEAGGTLPLVLFQHFRGNLDSWDPALIDALAAGRRVITFDYAGVGGSTGTTASTVGEMAREAIAFIAALELGQVDLLGFSIGSFVAQEVTLIRPAIARRVVLASSAPQGAAGMHGWAPEVIGAVGTPQTSPEEYLDVFFARSDSSRRPARLPSSACTRGTRTGTPLRTGPLARPSMTRSATGASPTTQRYSGSPPSSTRSSWPTATATR